MRLIAYKNGLFVLLHHWSPGPSVCAAGKSADTNGPARIFAVSGGRDSASSSRRMLPPSRQTSRLGSGAEEEEAGAGGGGVSGGGVAYGGGAAIPHDTMLGRDSTDAGALRQSRRISKQERVFFGGFHRGGGALYFHASAANRTSPVHLYTMSTIRSAYADFAVHRRLVIPHAWENNKLNSSSSSSTQVA